MELPEWIYFHHQPLNNCRKVKAAHKKCVLNINFWLFMSLAFNKNKIEWREIKKCCKRRFMSAKLSCSFLFFFPFAFVIDHSRRRNWLWALDAIYYHQSALNRIKMWTHLEELLFWEPNVILDYFLIHVEIVARSI